MKKMLKIQFIAILLGLLTPTIRAQSGVYKFGKEILSGKSEVVDFEFDGLIFVYVEIKGERYKFVLDSGAPTVISSKVKGVFDLVRVDSISDVANVVGKVNLVKIPKMQLGNITYENFIAAQGDFVALNYLNADGILGANLISKGIWDFDLENEKIKVYSKLEKKMVKGFNRVKIKKLNTGSPLLTVAYGDAVEEEIIFDTGYEGLFYISDTVFNILSENKLLDTIAEGRGSETYIGAFGEYKRTEVRCVTFNCKLGKSNIPKFISGVDQEESSNMGVEWFKYYRTILAGNKFYFRKNSIEMPAGLTTKGIGINKDSSGSYVSLVWENSKAQKIGLNIGDRVLSINNVDVSKLSTKEIKKMLKEYKEVILEINKSKNFLRLEDETIF